MTILKLSIIEGLKLAALIGLFFGMYLTFLSAVPTLKVVAAFVKANM